MFVSPDFAIIHNPRCGATVLARYLGAKLLPDVPLFALPQEIPGDAARRCKRVLPVRDPVERFISAARARWRVLHPGERLPSDDSLATAALTMLEASPEDAPREFWLQKEWACRKMDIILPVRSFARFANSRKTTGDISRHNRYPNTPVILSAPVRERIRERYEPDYEMFLTLPVWPSRKDDVWLLTGACKSCTDKGTFKKGKQTADAATADTSAENILTPIL